MSRYKYNRFHFQKRIEKIVHGLGRKMMGWDELLEGGVNKSTAIMSWRNRKAGIEASNNGHHVVFSPINETYYNLMQATGLPTRPCTKPYVLWMLATYLTLSLRRPKPAMCWAHRPTCGRR
ncbi:family 20 glycosylhydrolase [Sphingobacterium hotanense]|nr:family 20 glycosylhydrolase [Sphingobacterium hotanense]